MNFLLITGDDLSYHSTGHGGCEVAEITPTIDRLAAEGLAFRHAHCTVSLCQPSRSVLMTGLYPWNNGAVGFGPVRDDVGTLTELLRGRGYTTGIVGKAEHLSPPHKFPWHYRKDGYTREMEGGKNPRLFYKFCKEFLSSARPPFFLMANAHHPHRGFPSQSRYAPERVAVPAFLPDDPAVREDIARYYEGVSRCDETVAEVLRALGEADASPTLVVFTSDHGMAFPFVKAHCYPFSTRVPLVFHAPGRLPARRVDALVSGVDFMPSVLDVLGLPAPPGDGASYVTAPDAPRPFVYTCLVENYGGVAYQTRAVFDRHCAYVRNFWANGTTVFSEDGSLERQPAVQALRRHRPDEYRRLRYREPEEFYDLGEDPFACHNVVADPARHGRIKTARRHLRAAARASRDAATLAELRRRQTVL